jgi:hypothetical protein
LFSVRTSLSPSDFILFKSYLPSLNTLKSEHIKSGAQVVSSEIMRNANILITKLLILLRPYETLAIQFQRHVPAPFRPSYIRAMNAQYNIKQIDTDTDTDTNTTMETSSHTSNHTSTPHNETHTDHSDTASITSTVPPVSSEPLKPQQIFVQHVRQLLTPAQYKSKQNLHLY